MSLSCAGVARRLRRGGRVFAAAGILLATCLSVLADDPTIVKVEEDWELVVLIPEPERDSPQITTVISPWGSLSGLHAIFELNHSNYPDYCAGGMQLQVWYGTSLLTAKDAEVEGVLATENETITWTTSMRIDSGSLVFEVRNGNSNTWGAFGNTGYMKATLNTWWIDNLNYYSPSVTVANSGVLFGENRVTSLSLKRVRYYTSDGQVLESNEPIVVAGTQ